MQVIQCKNQSSNNPCIFRRKVAVQDILSHSQLIHEQTSLDDDIVNTPSILDYETTSTIPKHCLQYSIVYRAPHTSHHLQLIVDVVDVPYMVNTVPVSVDFLMVMPQLYYILRFLASYFLSMYISSNRISQLRKKYINKLMNIFIQEYLDNQRSSLRRPKTVKVSSMEDTLPKYIYLMKGESYNFTVTMSLDSGYPNRKYLLSCKHEYTGWLKR